MGGRLAPALHQTDHFQGDFPRFRLHGLLGVAQGERLVQPHPAFSPTVQSYTLVAQPHCSRFLPKNSEALQGLLDQVERLGSDQPIHFGKGQGEVLHVKLDSQARAGRRGSEVEVETANDGGILIQSPLAILH